jgi:UDP-N-acetyl-2-amino-2-deoxyglucuronate dehydrogenase
MRGRKWSSDLPSAPARRDRGPVQLTIRLGILGAGNISDTHARAAQAIPGVEIAAVYGGNREKVCSLAERTQAVAYDDLSRFLDHQPMDIVAIGSPSGLHAEQAIAAVRRGLHVIVEKPVDISVARVDALIAEANAAGKQVGVFFQDRLRPDVARIKELLDAGGLGHPVVASGYVKWYRPPDYYSSSRWRGTWALDGGGALMNQGIHTVDLLLWLAGPVARVTARTATRLHQIEVEDTAVAILEFASGALGVLEAATSIYPGYARRVELTGSEGTLILENDRLTAIDLKNASPSDANSASDAAPAASRSSPVVADASAHRRVIEDFIDAIRTGRSPACDAQEGRKSVELVEAIYRSARESCLVSL